MAKFDWQTEEDIVWEALPEPTPPKPPPNRRRRWLWAGSLLGLLGLVAGVVYWQVSKRVDLATQAVRDDVLSSYNLVQRSVAEQDVDLFQSLLSGRDMSWVNGVTELVEAQAFHDREPFSLRALPFVAETAVSTDTATELAPNSLQVTLSPDLTNAEITAFRPYSYQTADAQTETVTLEETAVYRLGSSRWLYAPPDAAFWGDLQTMENDRLTVRFRARDQEWIERLFADLTTILHTACQEVPDLACGRDLFVEIRFESNPSSLTADLTQWRPLAGRENGWELSLPTPTLVGLPIDEQGYEVLYRGYARSLITAVMLHQAGWECCQGQALALGLVDYELSRLQLQTWPISAADYEWAAAELVQISDLTPLYHIADLTNFEAPLPWRAIHTIIDYFLRSNANHSPMQLLRYLQESSSFFDWLRRILPPDVVAGRGDALLDSADRAWQLFAYTQTLDSGAVAPIAYPDQQLYQICVSAGEATEGINQTFLYRQLGEMGGWEQVTDLSQFVLFSPLPRGEGLIAQHMNFATGAWQTQLWQNGRFTPLNIAQEEASFSLGQTDPTGENLLVYLFPSESSQPELWRLGLSDCQQGDCAYQQLPGLPTWSPNGRFALFTANAGFEILSINHPNRSVLLDPTAAVLRADLPLTLGSADGETTVADLGSGTAPFWIDNSTFGFMRQSQDSIRRELVIGSVADPQPRAVLTSEAVAATLSEIVVAERVNLNYALPHPTDERLLFVVGFDRGRQDVYVWLFNWETGALDLLLSSGYTYGHSLSVSPNGRFLLLQGVETDARPNTDTSILLLHDLETGETRQYLTTWPFFAPIITYDWSSDSQWLSIAITPDQVALIALEHDYFELIPASESNCISTIWLNQ